MADPIEQIIETALKEAQIDFSHGRGEPVDIGLDFHLPAHDLWIEVKQFHTARVADQMSRAPNVIAIQGEAAARFFAKAITGKL